jgi:tight adherence protein C
MRFHNALTISIALIFLGVSLVLCFIAVRGAIQENSRVERRLAGGARLDNDEDVGIGAKSRAKRNLISQLGAHLTLPDAREITRLRFMLAQAGYFDRATVKSFLAARVVCLFGPAMICLLMWGTVAAKLGTKPAILVCFTLAGLGLLGPERFLKWKAGKRTDQCRKGFPDMMDLMTACVEAGLGMDAALIRVGHELGGRYPALKENLDIMNLELRAGRERNEAMINFAERINLDEAKALAVMLKQAEEMGSSVGKALRTFSEDMRHKRMMKAEEKAAALSAKLTVPLILFIFPTIMVMLMLPAGIRIMEGLSG